MGTREAVNLCSVSPLPDTIWKLAVAEVKENHEAILSPDTLQMRRLVGATVQLLWLFLGLNSFVNCINSVPLSKRFTHSIHFDFSGTSAHWSSKLYGLVLQDFLATDFFPSFISNLPKITEQEFEPHKSDSRAWGLRSSSKGHFTCFEKDQLRNLLKNVSGQVGMKN